MIIECITTGPLATNAYLVGCSKSKKACVIDPAMDSHDTLCNLAKKHSLTIKAVYLTHSHFDHIADVFLFKKEHIPIYVHPFDQKNLQAPGSDGLSNIFDLQGVEPDGLLEEGMQIPLGETSFTVLHTPGHSPGSICLYFPKEKLLFTGDLLFQGAYGRVDLPTGSARDLYQSLFRIIQLPKECRIFAGHGEETTLEAEKPWIDQLKRSSS